MSDKKYVKKNVSQEWLLAHGFHYSRVYSDFYGDAYTYVFPVYKYKNNTVLECELCIYLDGEVRVNVYDYNTKEIYHSFYNNTYDGIDNTVLKVVNRNISNKLKKFGVEKV